MKRISTLVVLLGLVIGAMLTGCNQSTNTPPAPGTNAAPAAPETPAPAK